jgi:hypothetical protein
MTTPIPTVVPGVPDGIIANDSRSTPPLLQSGLTHHRFKRNLFSSARTKRMLKRLVLSAK